MAEYSKSNENIQRNISQTQSLRISLLPSFPFLSSASTKLGNGIKWGRKDRNKSLGKRKRS